MRLLLVTGLLFAVACGDDGGIWAGPPDAKVYMDASTGCGRMPAAADRTRFVVVAHPYNAAGDATPTFEVLQLSAAGAITRFTPTHTFSLMTRAPFGVITFTPDGKVGIVPMDDGKLGVFSLDGDGNATVIALAFSGDFYADRVIMDPSGDRAWVTDSNTRENGGGIYQINIGCDGTLTDGGRVAAAKSPGGLAIHNGHAVVPAHDILGSPLTGDDVHLLDWPASGPPTVLGGGDAFGDDDSIFSGFALSHDGATAFIGDSNVVGTNRVGIVSVSATDIAPLAVISNITDPSGIAASPHGDVAIVTSSQPPNEGIYVLDKGGTNATWRNRGELTYVGAAAQLPGDVVTIDRGQLAGSVLVAELSKVRRVLFHTDGSVTDEGSLAFGSGLDQIVGAIGVTP
jgi:hypothetical protein